MHAKTSLRRSLAVALLSFVTSAGAMAAVNVSETGSSLLYPLFNLWQPVYTKAHPDVELSTASTGSGTGQAQSMRGLVQIGASDAYLSDAQMKEHPSMLNIPLAISSQMVSFNLPGLNKDHLKLSGPLLANINAGKVTKWNAPKIAKLNPGVKLPDQPIPGDRAAVHSGLRRCPRPREPEPRNLYAGHPGHRRRPAQRDPGLARA